MQRYVVQPYDTLFSIAHRFGVAPTSILSANPQILHHNYIVVGQIMSIPGVPISIIAPKQLEEIESNAENIIDDINMQDWNKANSKLSAIKNTFNELKPILQANSISPSLIYNINSAIIKLDEEVALKKIYESSVQANLITLYISYILDYYNVEIPTDIDKLDYLGRAIILNTEKNDWNSVNDNLDYVNVIWKSLKTRFPSKYNQDIIEFSQIIDSLGQLIKSKDAAQIIKKANDMLNKVYTFEEYFKRENENKKL